MKVSTAAPTTFLFGHFTQGVDYHTLRPEGSGDYLLIATIAGAGRLQAGDRMKHLLPGDALLYAPGARQSYGTCPEAGTWELAWAHFHARPQWTPLLQWPVWSPGTYLLRLPEGEARDGFEQAVRAMVAALRRPGSNGLAFALNRLEEALLWADLAARRDHSLQLDPRIRQAMDFLAGELTKPFSLESIARRCGLSITRFSHLFKQETGQTPQQFSERLRISQAGYLLRETNLSIAAIAGQCGYHDPLYFSRRFQRAMGTSPTLYRKTAQDRP